MAATQESLEEKLANQFDPYSEGTTESEEQRTTEADEERTEVEAQAEAEDSPEADETASEEEASQEAYVELELDGKAWQIPVELKDLVERGADYTRKTQDVARLSEAADQRSEALRLEAERQQFEASLSEEHTTLALLDAQIKQYKALDWSEFSLEQSMQHKMALDNLKEQRSEVEESMSSKREEWVSTQSKALDEFKEKSSDWLRKAIPGWNQDVANLVAQDAIRQGYTEQEVESIMDPRAVRTMYESMKYRQLVAESDKAKAKASKAPPVIKPGSVNKMPQDVRDKLAYKKQMAKLNKGNASEADKAKAIHEKLMKSPLFR